MLKFKIYFLEILKKLNFKNDGVHLLYICRGVNQDQDVREDPELDNYSNSTFNVNIREKS